MKCQRLSTVTLVLPLAVLACGADDSIQQFPQEGSSGSPGASAGRRQDGDTVPPTDEELQYGDEGDEPVSEADLEKGRQNVAGGFASPTAAQRAAAVGNHPNVDRDNVVPPGLKSEALAFYDANPGQFKDDYMGVIDMSQHSKEERFFLIDLRSGAVTKTVVAHGNGSDPSNSGTPTLFSNVNNSRMTSLGMYKTGEIYSSGKVGRALRLDGLQATNSAARSRGVVLHASNYVARGRDKQGRSWGCPAVSNAEVRSIQDKLMNGRLLLIEKGVSAVDGCDGKADGYYCSDESPSSAYQCRNGVRAGVTQCADSSKSCSGAAGRKASVGGGELRCE